MLTKAADQNKRTMCIALYNRELDKNSICPANHEVDYGHGWFYFDHGVEKHGVNVGRVEQRPELTAEADKKLAEGYVVLYSSTWNTFVLGDLPTQDEE